MSEPGTHPTTLAWSHCAFDALSPARLYAILQLRTEVFVIEQNCPFQDMDGRDAQALHLIAHAGDRLVAYARCFGPGVAFTEASIGRVITRMELRGSGAGHVLMQRAKDLIAAHWGPHPIRIGAQARLKRFYEGHGFVDMNLPYIEDGIPHIEMLHTPSRGQLPDSG